MAFFLLEDRDFKGFWMKIKVTLNPIFSNLNKCCGKRLSSIMVELTFTFHEL
jgi:hypothetical protein